MTLLSILLSLELPLLSGEIGQDIHHFPAYSSPLPPDFSPLSSSPQRKVERGAVSSHPENHIGSTRPESNWPRL